MRILNLLLLPSLFFLSAHAWGSLSCSKILKSPTPREAVAMFDFPSNAGFLTRESVMRRAIYEAFDGRDYYTGKKMKFHEMTIDHIIPKSKGGPNNIFNYVPTVAAVNEDKGSSFVWSRESRALSDVRDVYGPKVMAILEAQGVIMLKTRQLERLEAIRQQLKQPGYHIMFHGLTLEVELFMNHVFKEFSQRSEDEKVEIQRTNIITVPLLNFDEPEIEHTLGEFRYSMDYVDRDLRERNEAEGEVMTLQSEDFNFAARSEVDVRIHPEIIKKLIEAGSNSLSVDDILDSSAISREDFVNWTDFY